MSTVNDVLADVEEALGSRVYLVYMNDERHLIDQVVTGAIAMALLKDYLSGFLDLKSVGKTHREYLSELVQRLRNGAIVTPNDISEEPAIELAKIAREKAMDDATRQVAHDQLTQALIAFGLDMESAHQTAQSIAVSANRLVA